MRIFQYNIQKKDESGAQFDMAEGRIGAARKKTPEELAAEMHADEDSTFGYSVHTIIQI